MTVIRKGFEDRAAETSLATPTCTYGRNAPTCHRSPIFAPQAQQHSRRIVLWTRAAERLTGLPHLELGNLGLLRSVIHVSSRLRSTGPGWPIDGPRLTTPGGACPCFPLLGPRDGEVPSLHGHPGYQGSTARHARTRGLSHSCAPLSTSGTEGGRQRSSVP